MIRLLKDLHHDQVSLERWGALQIRGPFACPFIGRVSDYVANLLNQLVESFFNISVRHSCNNKLAETIIRASVYTNTFLNCSCDSLTKLASTNVRREHSNMSHKWEWVKRNSFAFASPSSYLAAHSSHLLLLCLRIIRTLSISFNVRKCDGVRTNLLVYWAP